MIPALIAVLILLAGCGQSNNVNGNNNTQSPSSQSNMPQYSTIQSEEAIPEAPSEPAMDSDSFDDANATTAPVAQSQTTAISTGESSSYIQKSIPSSNKEIQSIQNTQKPLLLNDCKIMYEDTKYKWPFIYHSVTNQTDKTISGYQLAWLAFDKNGNPLELYWDARNVDKSGDHGNVGFGNGIDYGIVVGIKEYSPKSYVWLLDTTQSISPNQTIDQGGWPLFDGWWNQSNGEHKVKYIISSIKQVTFKDETIWENPQYSEWMETYKGKSVNLDTLQSYYPCA